ncbi:FAR-17a/AIG1-like protein [Mycena albidolilacea]|uniref:FAR-17a/AIG1-like protein n=1 Tax=Mycena albidolilacea TaxID=1033008 RepID=A0AAD7EQY4_9AGAR|nr:FAR-17a/AIG1-like protein [Mycena albidolilacea]
MVQTASVALHVGAISAMSYGYNALHGLGINTWISSQYGGHFQYLTIQGLAVAWLTMVVGLLEDFFPSIKGVRAVKRGLFIVALPVATVISSIYWTLLLCAPNLILQEMPSGESPVWLPLRIDLSLHAVPCVALLADFMIFERKYGRKAIQYVAPALSLLCTLWYGWWVEYCASMNGTFPYPFLTLNPFEIRLRIYAGAGAVACLSFYALNALHPKSR